ncbi:MAG TPA: gluconate 2-dehydrogenase subunit 3 family protein [Gaiellaceae bacterium]|nr:gluconate 2-dehydrogenase subunit 3 family protein [Gaiellaceae bacterium]
MEQETEPRDAELISRRELLKRGAAVGVVVTLPAFGTAHASAALESRVATAQAARTSALSAQQSAVLEALVERLVPADGNGPGAKEAGAAAYIERSLDGGLAGGLKAVAPLYSAGLSAVDAYAQSAYGAAFTALPPEKQDAVLNDLAADKATGFDPSSSAFFETVREHTLQGMFCDPIYGGNKDFAGWKLLRYPGVKMPVSPHDQRVGVAVKPARKSTYAGGAIGEYPRAKKEAVA